MHSTRGRLLRLTLGLLLVQCRAADRTPPQETPAVGNDKIRLTAPLAQAIVPSPLTVSGEARGTWYFEASFPVRLIDANGGELAAAPARAKGDWMTSEFVPFDVVLTFSTPATATGTLVLVKDNPSGLPANADSISTPVRFQ